jgi:deoxycytidylate deaminase
LNRGYLKDHDEHEQDGIYLAFTKACRHAMNSPDNSTQVGATILDLNYMDRNAMYLTGDHNRFVKGFRHHSPRLNDREYKNMVIQHAEKNAIRSYIKNNKKDPKDLIMVATWAACAGCAADIIEHGIKRVYTDYNIFEFGRKVRSTESSIMWEKSVHAALDMFEETGVQFMALIDLPDLNKENDLELSQMNYLVSGHRYFPFLNN